MGQRLPRERLVHRRPQQIAAMAIKPTDDNALGVEQIDDDRQRLAEAYSRSPHDFERKRVTAFGGVSNLPRRDVSIT